MSDLKCKCNYHLGMGPNLLCPVHGKREDLSRRIQTLEKEIAELREKNNSLWTELTVALQKTSKDYRADKLQQENAELRAALRAVLPWVGRNDKHAQSIFATLNDEHLTTIQTLIKENE